jgi:ATP-dependent exoDNAse (exonuclease V) beta subunit
MQRDNYSAIKAANYSSLKILLDSPEEYKHQILEGNAKEHSGTDVGSLVHCLLLEPDEFHNQFCIMQGTTPGSAQQKQFVDILVGAEHMDLQDPNVIAKAYQACYKNVADAKALTEGSKMFSQLEDYIFFVKNQNGRLAVTQDVYETAKEMARICMAHPAVNIHLNKDGEHFNEEPIVWKSQFSDMPLKSKVDKLIVDHEKKKAYYYDYKTTRHYTLNSFRYAIMNLHYDMQLSFYETAIAQWLFERYGHSYQVESHIIAQKNAAPYQVLGVMKLHPEDMMKGWYKWTNALVDLTRRVRENDWYASQDHTIELNVYNRNEVFIGEDDTSF